MSCGTDNVALLFKSDNFSNKPLFSSVPSFLKYSTPLVSFLKIFSYSFTNCLSCEHFCLLLSLKSL